MTEKQIFIVAVDGSECALRAAEFAAHETVLRGGTLLLVHVVDWSGFEVLPVRELETRHARKEKTLLETQEKIIAPVLHRLDAEGLKVESRIEFGDPDAQILALVEETGARQLFVGRHAGSHTMERIVGSLPTDLARRSPVPVTIVP